jgi:hypothetical protein
MQNGNKIPLQFQESKSDFWEPPPLNGMKLRSEKPVKEKRRKSKEK